jgi:hypothetical protein
MGVLQRLLDLDLAFLVLGGQGGVFQGQDFHLLQAAQFLKGAAAGSFISVGNCD